MITVYDVLGTAGITLTFYTYARVQWQRNYAKKIQFSLYNLIASGLMIVSLSNDWNLPAFISAIAWGLASVYGVVRCLKHPR